MFTPNKTRAFQKAKATNMVIQSSNVDVLFQEGIPIFINSETWTETDRIADIPRLKSEMTVVCSGGQASLCITQIETGTQAPTSENGGEE